MGMGNSKSRGTDWEPTVVRSGSGRVTDRDAHTFVQLSQSTVDGRGLDGLGQAGRWTAIGSRASRPRSESRSHHQGHPAIRGKGPGSKRGRDALEPGDPSRTRRHRISQQHPPKRCRGRGRMRRAPGKFIQPTSNVRPKQRVASSMGISASGRAHQDSAGYGEEGRREIRSRSTRSSSCPAAIKPVGPLP